MTVHLNLSFRSVIVESNHSLKSRTVSGLLSQWSEWLRLRMHFISFYLSPTRSQKSFIINCCLARVSLWPRPRLILNSDIPTSTSSIETSSVSPSWLVITLWLVVISAPHLSHLPALWGWTTASPQNPASKWISHGVTTLFTIYVCWILTVNVYINDGLKLVSWAVN